jgi:ferredoxin-NADP reductase
MPTSALLSGETVKTRVHVASIDRQADGVVSLQLRSQDGSLLPGWAPGAHIEIELDGGVIRHYSLCGRPDDSANWRIAVFREPASRGGSKVLHEGVRPGDVISVKGLRNNFALVDSDRYLFIAGGIGVTPILPMVREVAARGKPWSLTYGGRTRTSMAFVEELCEIAGGDLRVVPEDEYGLLDLDGLLSEPRADTSIYCCGPGPLLDAVEQRCKNWPAGALHVERFTPRERPDTCRDGEFDVELAQSGRRLRVPDDRSLLEVLEDAGLAIDNSCRAGICGTCEIRVVDGIPEHNDDVLSDDERESNDVMLPCVSRSRTAVLVVDL